MLQFPADPAIEPAVERHVPVAVSFHDPETDGENILARA